MLYFTIFQLSYVISFGFALFHYHATTRQRMMFMKLFACVFAAYYFWGMGAETAMLACFIAGFGSLMQGVFPDHLLERTRVLRSGLAVALAGAAIVISAGNSLEALPLLATICSRFSEVQSCRQRIRMGWVFSQTLWLTYAVMSGLILLYITENLNLLSNLKAIWEHEQKHKKLVPIPVPVA